MSGVYCVACSATHLLTHRSLSGQASEADKNLPLVREMRQLIDDGKLREARGVFEAVLASLEAAVKQASRALGGLV